MTVVPFRPRHAPAASGKNRVGLASASTRPAPAPGWTAPESPFHSGELEVQERVGVREHIDAIARRAGIRDYMPEQHRRFFSERPFLLIGAVDSSGQPWATIITGQPGFVTTPDARTLRINALPLPGNPLQGQIHAGSFLATLGIQFTTGRRNRANGVVSDARAGALTLAVRQSYGNCHKYIQSREPRMFQRTGGLATNAITEADHLSRADQELLGRADTFFIASACLAAQARKARGADVSHRGGRPGFIRIDDNRTLTFPDFAGNLFYNTIGNLMRDPRAGLLFIDFDTADLVYIAGCAHIIWNGAQVDSFAGAQRLVQLHVNRVRRVARCLPIRWSAVRYSEQLNDTGTWQEAGRLKQGSAA